MLDITAKVKFFFDLNFFHFFKNLFIKFYTFIVIVFFMVKAVVLVMLIFVWMAVKDSHTVPVHQVNSLFHCFTFYTIFRVTDFRCFFFIVGHILCDTNQFQMRICAVTFGRCAIYRKVSMIVRSWMPNHAHDDVPLDFVVFVTIGFCTDKPLDLIFQWVNTLQWSKFYHR